MLQLFIVKYQLLKKRNINMTLQEKTFCPKITNLSCKFANFTKAHRFVA